MNKRNFKILGYSLLILITIIGAGFAIPIIVVISGFVGFIFAGFLFAFGIGFWVSEIKRTVNQPLKIQK